MLNRLIETNIGTRERVWGNAWRFSGLAYCIGGRSLYGSVS
jgi:hypothetical protein